MKQLVVFDLDGTLAEGKSALDAEMALLLEKLLGILKVAIISGGEWRQFETQVLAHLPAGPSLANLSLLPTCGTRFYRYRTGWELLYAQDFTAPQKRKILDALRGSIGKAGDTVRKTWGEVIEDRGSQITYSALGQHAPLEEKKKWDPDLAKRRKLIAVLQPLIPEFSVNLGGATSVDITRHGIDKGYGIRKLRDELGVEIQDMLFIGDAVFPGGNDYPARQAGAPSIRVRDPHETKRVIEAILVCAR
jgi:HAD superfamily hydrolase (TIGR01484 family)